MRNDELREVHYVQLTEVRRETGPDYGQMQKGEGGVIEEVEYLVFTAKNLTGLEEGPGEYLFEAGPNAEPDKVPIPPYMSEATYEELMLAATIGKAIIEYAPSHGF